MRDRVRVVVSVFREAFENSDLRRVGFAYFFFNGAECGMWIALIVFAYGQGGSTAGMVMMLAQLLPCAALAPFVGALTDRRHPTRVLCVGYGAQTVAIAGVSLAIAANVPVGGVIALAPLTALTFMITRPTHAALLPAIVRTPGELTAASVMGGWADGGSSLMGPVVVGVVVSWRGVAPAVLSMSGLTLVSTLLIVSVMRRSTVAASNRIVAQRDTTREAAGDVHRLSAGRATWAAVRSRTWATVATTLRHPQMRVLLLVQTFYFALVGSLDLLCVILAVRYLHMGRGGAGYLNAVVGGGALLAGFITAFLVGRRYIANTMMLNLALSVASLAVVAATRSLGPVMLLLGAVGMFGAVFSVTAQTLLLRSAPSDSIAGSFSILEALLNVGLAVGAVFVRLALALGGIRLALLTPAVIGLALALGLWRQLHKIDVAATVPQVEVRLLRSIPFFAALPAPSIEALARGAETVREPCGTVVITEGDGGNCYYAVADGELTVTRAGRVVQELTRGGGFGELALIREIPRQATVTATTDVLLLRITKEPFIEVLTGYASAASAAEEVIIGYSRDDDAE
jgi:hypothetical protein